MMRYIATLYARNRESILQRSQEEAPDFMARSVKGMLGNLRPGQEIVITYGELINTRTQEEPLI